MALITKPNTFSSGATIVAAEHNSNHDTIYDDYNGSITNANIGSSAAIVGSKLDLSAAGTIGGTTPSPGTFTTLTSTGNTTLGNASGDDVTITGSIAASIPLKAENVDIGTTSIGLNDLHFGSGGIINFDGGDVTITHSANTLAVAGGAVTFDGAVTLGNATGDDINITGSIAASIPLKDETIDIGTTALGLNDLHFGSGGIINWDGGDITLTHAAGKLTFGGDGSVELDFNNHEMTNVDINSGTFIGTLDGLVGIDFGSDATGDVWYRNASGDMTRLAKGTDGQFLKIGASIPEWATVTTPGLTFVGKSEVTDTDTTGTVTIVADKDYRIVWHGQAGTNAGHEVRLLIGGAAFNSVQVTTQYSDASVVATSVGAGLTDTAIPAAAALHGTVELSTQTAAKDDVTYFATATHETHYVTARGDDSTATPTDVSIILTTESGTAAPFLNMYVYEYAQS